jgi:TRAP-type C4-dicarboxylate transport system substrate-binding protein
MRVFLKTTTMLLAIAAASTSSAGTRWDMATPYGDATYHTQNIRQFAEDVQAATDGEFEIVVHAGGSLIKHKEIARAVRSRQVPIGEVFVAILGNEDPVYKLDNLPFLATDFEQAEKLYDASKEALENKLSEDGMMLLYSVPWPPQGIYSDKAINSVEDLEGGKMRAYSSTLSQLAVLLNASPTTVQNVEIPQAFSTGIIDMMITSSTTGVSSQSWDYVSHYTDVQAWIPKNMVIVNKRVFKRLDKKSQQALLQAATAAELRGWEMAKKETTINTQILAEKGINIAVPTEALMTSLNSIGDVMAKDWITEAGSEGKTIIEAYKK